MTNFGPVCLAPLDLLNKLHEYHLEEMFHNIGIVLQIFLTIPVSVATGERSFSKLRFIENDYRTSMTQKRLNNLAILSIESGVARSIDFSPVVMKYAIRQSRAIHSFF